MFNIYEMDGWVLCGLEKFKIHCVKASRTAINNKHNSIFNG